MRANLRLCISGVGALLALTLVYFAVRAALPAPANCSIQGTYYQDYSKWNPYEKNHTGVDFGCGLKTQVTSPVEGKVYAIFDNWWSYGKDLWIQTGSHYLFYAHLTSVNVKEGDTVSAGQPIALSGESGWDLLKKPTTTGPVLHWGCSDKPPEKFVSFYEHKQEVGSGWMDPFTCLTESDTSGKVVSPQKQSPANGNIGGVPDGTDKNVGGGMGPAKDGSAPISFSKPGDVVWDSIPGQTSSQGAVVEKMLNVQLPKPTGPTPFDYIRMLPLYWYLGLFAISVLLVLVNKSWRPLWIAISLITTISMVIVLFVPAQVVPADTVAGSSLGAVPQQVLDPAVEKEIIFPDPPTPAPKPTSVPQNTTKASGAVNKQASQSNNANCAVSGKYPQDILQWCGFISTYASKNHLDPNLVAATMLQESGGNPNAYSGSGAVGLLQVMPKDGLAASFMCSGGPCFANRPSTAQLKDPEYNVSYSTGMLSGLKSRYGSDREALRSYGPMDVGYSYADTVLAIYQRYQ